MADLVKRERRKEVFKVGSRVSVPNFFFDIDGSVFSLASTGFASVTWNCFLCFQNIEED